MTDPVKSTRRYDSPRRREQAVQTRQRILSAGERRFARDGYAATPVTAVAADAGVTAKTVYAAYETKSGLLRALWNVRLRGDEDDVPVGDREWFRALLAEPDPEQQLRAAVHRACQTKVRISDVLRIIRAAAPVDPDIAGLWERIQDDFYENQRTIVRSLDAKGGLRAGLSVDAATDILWTLNHPDVWLLLVGRRGWTAERFEDWLWSSAAAQLLDG